MIERYTRPKMGKIWSTESRFHFMLEVEKSVAVVQGELGLIPKAAARAIQRKGNFSLKKIQSIEKKTKHDVIAFVSSVAENVGTQGRYVHYGLTSSDVLDTALSLQIQKAASVICESMGRLEKSLSKQIRKHKDTRCAGRTHGVHAEPTTWGLKLAGFYEELKRNQKRFRQAIEDIRVGKLSGAVGTYSFLGMNVEKKVCQRLGLKTENVATQVIPRDRHAEVILSLSLIGAFLERLSVELRHLQRTEVGEVVEGFTKGQKGSSAMPHKKNPISGENLTGVSRVLRSYGGAAIENIALWHERDISHSSVERIVFPDAFILCDYALDRMVSVIDNLYVDSERMIFNMELSQGQLYSSHLLLALVKKGLSREKAYEMVQKLSHGLKRGDSLEEKVLSDNDFKRILTKKEVNQIFSGETHKKVVHKIIDRTLK